MKKLLLLSAFAFAFNILYAQGNDTLVKGNVTLVRDSRMNDLEKKEVAFNEAFALAPKAGKGYRLMVLSTNDRPMAMNVRAQLLQHYPDQKVYTVFQTPYIKLKMGNFVDKNDAENLRKEILKNKIVTGNIYVVPDMIEIKPDKPVKETE